MLKSHDREFRNLFMASGVFASLRAYTYCVIDSLNDHRCSQGGGITTTDAKDRASSQPRIMEARRLASIFRINGNILAFISWSSWVREIYKRYTVQWRSFYGMDQIRRVYTYAYIHIYIYISKTKINKFEIKLFRYNVF